MEDLVPVVAIYMSAKSGVLRRSMPPQCVDSFGTVSGAFWKLWIHWAGRGESVESWGACTNHQLAPQCKAWRPIITGQGYL